VLVIDELVRPVLTGISTVQWDGFKRLILGSGKPVLWVTKGAQTEHVSTPDNALVLGLFRVIRREDPSVRLVTLDVQSPASAAAHWAVQQVLRTLTDGEIAETEYAERDGLLLVSRVMPDKHINDLKAAEQGTGLELVDKKLHANPAQVRL
jgi:hypothetical protein